MPLIITTRQLTQRSHFYRQFAQLTAAGLGPAKTLEILERNPPARSFRAPIREMIGHLEQGDTVSDALKRLGRWMPSFDIALIEAGEKSGRLDAVMRLLADYYEERAQMLRQMLTDLAYPLFVFHFMIFLLPVISLFNGGTFPQYLLKTFGVIIPLYVLVFAVVYALQGRRGALWRSVLERLLRPIPILGTARHYLALSRLAAALEALINAGVTIIEAWEMAATACGSPAIQRAVDAWKPEVVGGKTLAEVVNKSHQFPELFANLYYSGEMSGGLDETLQRLHKYYQEEGSRKLRFVAKWFPQMVYLAVAGIVAFKVITFYVGQMKQWDQIW